MDHYLPPLFHSIADEFGSGFKIYQNGKEFDLTFFSVQSMMTATVSRLGLPSWFRLLEVIAGTVSSSNTAKLSHCQLHSIAITNFTTVKHHGYRKCLASGMFYRSADQCKNLAWFLKKVIRKFMKGMFPIAFYPQKTSFTTLPTHQHT